MSTAPERWLFTWYNPHGLGGVETFLQRLALVRGNVDLWVAAIHSLSGPFAGRLEQLGCKVLDWTWFYPAYEGRASSAAVCRRLCQGIFQIQPTVLSINGCCDFGCGTAPLLRGIRKHCTILDHFHVDDPEDRQAKARLPYERLVDGMGSCNARSLARLESRRSWTMAMRHVPYGIPVPGPRPVDRGGELRLLYAGRLVEEQKRVSLLPEVLEPLRSQGRAFRLTIAGDGPARPALAAQLESRGLAKYVTFLGFVPPERLSKLYLQHDLLINVSDYEGFSISVMEAMVAGCVPACTDLSGRDPTALIDNETCLLAPINDVPQLGRKVAAVSWVHLDHMSARTHEVVKHCTPATTWQGLVALVEEARRLRPIQPWEAGGVLQLKWDVSRHNPWIPHPHPIRRVLAKLRGGVAGGVSQKVASHG